MYLAGKYHLFLVVSILAQLKQFVPIRRGFFVLLSNEDTIIAGNVACMLEAYTGSNADRLARSANSTYDASMCIRYTRVPPCIRKTFFMPLSSQQHQEHIHDRQIGKELMLEQCVHQSQGQNFSCTRFQLTAVATPTPMLKHLTQPAMHRAFLRFVKATNNSRTCIRYTHMHEIDTYEPVCIDYSSKMQSAHSLLHTHGSASKLFSFDCPCSSEDSPSIVLDCLLYCNNVSTLCQQASEEARSWLGLTTIAGCAQRSSTQSLSVGNSSTKDAP